MRFDRQGGELRSWAALVVMLAASTAHAGTVRGQLVLPIERGDPSPEGLWRIDNGILPVTPRTLDPRSECMLVFVPKAESHAKEARKEETVTVELHGLRLVPAVIAVPLGATLEIKNDDRVPHTLSVPAPDEDVLPPRPTPASASRIDRQQRPGVFAIRDDELPHLHGWIIVTDGGAALRPDEHGAFHGDVADGRYTVKVFVHGAYVLERSVEVGGKTLELQLAVPGRGARKDPAGDKPAEPAIDQPVEAPPASPPDGGAAQPAPKPAEGPPAGAKTEHDPGPR